MIDPTDDKRLARIFLQAAEGFQDDDMVECGIAYLLDAGQCRRIAAYLNGGAQMKKKETYPEYVRRREAEKPGDAAKRKVGKALATKKFSPAAGEKAK